MSSGRERDSILKNFDWKPTIIIFGAIITPIVIILTTLYIVDPQPIFFWLLVVLATLGGISLVILFFVSYKKSRSKEPTYSLRKFRKLYFKYVKRNIADLEKFHRFTFITNRTCSKVKWSNDVGHFKPDENNTKYTVVDIIETIPKSESNIVVIMGEMGIGKSVFSLEILKQNITNKKLTIHIELSQWPPIKDNENQDLSLLGIVKAMLNANERLSNEATTDRTKNSYEKFKLGLKNYLKDQKGLIIFEGLDEFKEGKKSILNIAKFLVNLKHQVIITGRNYSIMQLGIKFESGKATFVETFKLNLLKDSQVKLFIDEFARREALTHSITFNTIKKIIQPSENYPELNHRNPLVIQAIAYSYRDKNTEKNTKSRKLKTLDILEEISKYIFAWHTGRELDIKPFNFQTSEKDGYDFLELKRQYFRTHQKLASELIVKNTLSRLRLNEILCENKKKLVNNNKLIESIITNNFCFVIRASNTYQILPDRIFDYFSVKNIVECATLHQKVELRIILKKIINNTSKFRNLISLLQQIMEKLSKYDFYNEIETSISKRINGMSVIYQLGLNWSNSKIQITEGKIKALNLSSSKIKALPVNFGELFKLQKLDLHKNELSSLPESFFSLKRLQVLNLHKNKLFFLPESVSSFQRLQILSLWGNELSSLPEGLASLQELQMLSLWDNLLSSLPESLYSLQKLQELHLGWNQLSSLPEAFSSFKKLQVLYLNNNLLSSLPENLTSLQELRELKLGGNKLSSIPESMFTLTNLRELDLSSNELSSLPENLSSLQELRKLHLGWNQLSSIPESMFTLTNLRELDLSSNELSSLPENLSSLQELRELHLEWNQLSSLPESMFTLKKLQILNLSKNMFSSLPEGLSSLENLKKLYLDSNQRSTFSKKSKNILEKLSKAGCEIMEW